MEAVVVMVLTGILVGAVAVFIPSVMQGYNDSARRAGITDTADTAVRRIARDLHLALPNSVRITGGNQVLEFLSTRTGGRYRYAKNLAGDDILDFSAPDTTFEVLGPAIARVAGDQIVVFNLGISGADAYAGDNRTSFSSAAGNIITIASKQFPFDSPSHRFQVVDAPVTYFCDTAGGKLWRYWGYTIQASQASVDSIAELDALVTPATSTRGKALLAQNLSTCDFSYSSSVTQRTGLVSMSLSFTQSGETVSLYHAVHVSNVP
jgi:MSHA biogenesis protein MshO